MEGWLEWFEERAAILEFEAGMRRSEAEAERVKVALALMKKTGERPADLLCSRYNFHFYELLDMGVKVKGEREVVACRWRHCDGHERVTFNWYSEEQAQHVFGER
jgi:hypothetical protein